MAENKTKFDVTGMSCAACQAHVEKAVSSLEGVKSCEVSLLTNSMQVTGSVSSEEVIRAVENAGYGASLADLSAKKDPAEKKRSGQGNICFEKANDLIPYIPCCSHVFFHGRNDVRMACTFRDSS